MAQDRCYYNSKNEPLQIVDETIVCKIISMYEEGDSITVIVRHQNEVDNLLQSI